MKHKTLKRDILSIGLCLLLAGTAFLCVFLFRKEGTVVRITVDKEEVGVYDLSLDREINLDGHNTVVIEGGKVRMESADCPDRLCVKKGEISYAGQSIVCLPNKTVVEISGEPKDSVDFTQGGGALP